MHGGSAEHGIPHVGQTSSLKLIDSSRGVWGGGGGADEECQQYKQRKVQMLCDARYDRMYDNAIGASRKGRSDVVARFRREYDS